MSDSNHIKFNCPQPDCGQRLKASYDMSGRPVKCSKCGRVVQVPKSTEAARDSVHQGNGATPIESWHVRTGDGKTYGPITKQELDRWVAERRVNAACHVARAGDSKWLEAAEVYLDLAAQVPPLQSPTPIPVGAPLVTETPNPLAISEQPSARLNAFTSLRPRYFFLRIVSVVCYVVAGLKCTAGAILLTFGLFVAGFSQANNQRETAAIGLLTGTGLAFWAIPFFLAALLWAAFAAWIRLQIDVEENTRASVQLLRALVSRPS